MMNLYHGKRTRVVLGTDGEYSEIIGMTVPQISKGIFAVDPSASRNSILSSDRIFSKLGRSLTSAYNMMLYKKTVPGSAMRAKTLDRDAGP
jgi:hypothetical protein